MSTPTRTPTSSGNDASDVMVIIFISTFVLGGVSVWLAKQWQVTLEYLSTANVLTSQGVVWQWGSDPVVGLDWARIIAVAAIVVVALNGVGFWLKSKRHKEQW